MDSISIAMWSGPRNISTALMRAFESRADTEVVDEPFYGHYLHQTGKEHPMHKEVLASMEWDGQSVGRALCAPLPPGTSIRYQKHMAHHLLPGTDRGWMDNMRHAFLIREPRAMLASLSERLGAVELQDTGLPQQMEIHAAMTASDGSTPPVIDSSDLLRAPEPMLRRLCQALDIPFDGAMLRWEAGPRTSDGVWGAHWYANTLKSTGFTAPPNNQAPPTELPPELEPLARECETIYGALAQNRLQIS